MLLVLHFSMSLYYMSEYNSIGYSAIITITTGTRTLMIALTVVPNIQSVP